MTDTATTWGKAPASAAQITFIESLLISKETGRWHQIYDLCSRAGVTKGQASDIITGLKECADKVIEGVEGYYSIGEDFYHLMPSVKHGKTYWRLYKLYVYKTYGGQAKVKWSAIKYGASAVVFTAGHQAMTLAQAAEYGHAHGHCLRCGKALSDPKSVAAGVGPVCAKAFA